MQFQIIHALGLLTGIAILMSWWLVPEELRLDWQEWNQASLPYKKPSIPAEFSHREFGRAEIPWTHLCGAFQYKDGKELFETNHLWGWANAVRDFLDKKHLQRLATENLLDDVYETWTEQHRQLALRLGYNDALIAIDQLSKKHGDEKYRELLIAPTPWYFPYNRPIIYTAVYVLILAGFAISKTNTLHKFAG